MRQAVFVDKDGTLVHNLPYNVNADRLRLREDAGRALRRLQDAGFALILVSNQSGIAHGRFDEAALRPIWSRLALLLWRDGVALDAYYYCPHHPEGIDPRYSHPCNCRKPRPGLLLRAAEAHGIDLRRSWLIGDILDDVEAGRRAGCRAILLDAGSETEWRREPLREPHFIAASLSDAATHIVKQCKGRSWQ